MAYQLYRTLTINHTLCGASDSTNFPVLFSGTYAYLKTVANGGNVTNANGYDIAFYSNSTGTSLLDFELVSYDATTGIVEMWVRVPTLSHTVDTVIYLFYSNSSISTYQGNTNGTWNSNFLAVHHYKDGTTLSLIDSTSNGFNGTGTGTPTAAVGQIDGAIEFNGTSQYVTDSTFAMANGDPFTMSCWVNPDTSAAMNMMGNVNTDAPYLHKNASDKIVSAPWALSNPSISTGTITPGSWSLVTATKVVADYVRLYINGTQVSYDQTGGTGQQGGFTGMLIGAYFGAILKWDGKIDEVHILKVALSADWITTEYNNQVTPASFYTVGAAVPIGGGGVGGSTLGKLIGNLNTVRIH